MRIQLTLKSGFLRSSKYLEILSNNGSYLMGSDAAIDLSKLLPDECTYQPQCRDFPLSCKHLEILANKSALVLLYKSAHIIYPGMGISPKQYILTIFPYKSANIIDPDTGAWQTCEILL